jgi:hypothetical protein
VRAPSLRGAWPLALATILLAACDSTKVAVDGAGAGATCLEEPNALPRPPAAGLPCELLPPGLTLTR